MKIGRWFRTKLLAFLELPQDNFSASTSYFLQSGAELSAYCCSVAGVAGSCPGNDAKNFISVTADRSSLLRRSTAAHYYINNSLTVYIIRPQPIDELTQRKNEGKLRESPSGRIRNVREEWNRPPVLNQPPRRSKVSFPIITIDRNMAVVSG